MSITVTSRVWAHCAARGARKLLMLALAEHATDDGFCWPKPETLADMIGERTIYTRELLAEAVARGDVLKQPGGGRGNVTIYAVASGLDAERRAQLAARLSTLRVHAGVLTTCGKIADENTPQECTVFVDQNSTLQNTVFECTVSEQRAERIPMRSRDKNSTPECTDNKNSTLQNSVYQSVELGAPMPKQHEIHGDDHDGDGVGAHSEKLFTRRARRPNSQPRHVIYLAEKGMGAAHLFAQLDSDAAITDFDNRIADGWDVRSIVTAWRTLPPQPGRVYVKQQNTTDDSARRESTPSRNAARARRGVPAERAPRPGERDYYKRG